MSQELAFSNNGLFRIKDRVKQLTNSLSPEALVETAKSLIQILHNEESEIGKMVHGLKSLQSKQNQRMEKDVFVKNANYRIQSMTSYIGEWCIFLQKWISLEQSQVAEILRLLHSIIKEIQIIFCHCKESSAVYESYFLEVSSSLSNLFKSTYQTLKVALELLEKIDISRNDDESISEYSNALMALFEVARILKDIDLMPLVTTLRSLNRIIIARRLTLHDKLDVIQMFAVVCRCISDKLNYCWSVIEEAVTQNQADTKRTSKVVKVLRFLVSMLLQLTKEYKNEIFGEATLFIIDILLQMQRMTPMSSNQRLRGTHAYEEFCSSVLSVIEPLLVELIEERDFIFRVRSLSDNFHSQGDGKQLLSALLLATTIATCLVKTKDHATDEWMKELSSASGSPLSIIALTLSLYEKCVEEVCDEVSIPSFIEAGKPFKDVSLHEFVCIRLCSLITTFNSSNFQIMEEWLLRNLLTSKYSHTLSADILSFVARWGPERICCQFVEFFSHLSCAIFEISSLQSESLNRCLLMVKRLFMLLSDSKKEEILQKFHPSKQECLPIWTAIPIDSLSQPLTEKFAKTLVTVTLKGLEEYKTEGKLKMMMLTIRVWENCLQNGAAIECLAPVQRNGVVEIFMEVFHGFKESECEEIDEQFVCLILGATCNLIGYLEERQIQEVLEVTLTLLECNKSELLYLRACHLLAALKSKVFNPGSEEGCLALISKSFQNILSHDSCFVRFAAMTSLKSFAEVTRHTEIVCECLPQQMDDSFSNFLNCNTVLVGIPDEEKLKRLTSAIDSMAESAKQNEIWDTEQQNSSPLSPVREPDFEKLHKIAATFDGAVKELKKYKEDHTLPEWMMEKMKLVAQEITVLSSITGDR